MRMGPDIFDDDAMPLELGGLRLRPDGTLPAVTEGPPLAREEKLDVRLHGDRAAFDEYAIHGDSPVIRCGRRGLESRAPQRRQPWRGAIGCSAATVRPGACVKRWSSAIDSAEVSRKAASRAKSL